MEKLTKREKVMLGVSIGLGVVAAGTAGYFGVKYYGTVKENKILESANNILKETNDILKETNDILKDKVTTLMEAASEGVFEEAIGTVNNKINTRTDKRKYLLEALLKNPNDVTLNAALEKVETELANLYKRKDKFTVAQAFYAIQDIEEEL